MKAEKPSSVPQAPSPTMTSFLLISLIVLVVAVGVGKGANAVDQRPNVGTTGNRSTTLERNTLRQSPHHYRNLFTSLAGILATNHIVISYTTGGGDYSGGK